MKKILFVSNTSMHINLCYLEYIKCLKEHGYIVDVATNTNGKIKFCNNTINIPIHRSPFRFGNIISIVKLKKLIKEKKYNLILCSTPMGGFVARVAAKSFLNITKVIYTVHGFHFYKGNNIIKNRIFFAVEKMLSKYCNVIITINKEDYNIAKKYFATDIRLINGIGFDSARFDRNLSKHDKTILKQQLNINLNDYVVIYVAELSKRKKQYELIKYIKKSKLNNITFLFVGHNMLGKKIDKYINKNKLTDKIKILGFRNDISNLLDISDVAISVSSQEGLPLNIMEALYKNKPVIATNCRGNRDIIDNNKNGFLVSVNDYKALINKILELKDLGLLYKPDKNKNDLKKYSLNQILPEYINVFMKYMK